MNGSMRYILAASVMFLSCTETAIDPHVHGVHSAGRVMQVRVEFDTSFSPADVDGVARNIIRVYGHKSSLLIAYFDRAKDAMGLAYPHFRGGGAHVSEGMLYQTMTQPWPLTTFAQMMVRGKNATLWYRDREHIKQWNVSGTEDASNLGNQHWIRSAKVTEDPAEVIVWVETRAFPTEATCDKVGRSLAAEWQSRSLLVIVRNDAWFGWSEGPMYNPFAKRTEPPPPMAEMVNAPRCVAWIEDGRNKLQ